MNDFSEIENELKALRPTEPSPRLFQAVARELEGPAQADATADNIIHPNRFRFGWISLGLGLAAAALFILARIDFPTVPGQAPAVVSTTPTPVPASQLNSAQFIPDGATRVVYRTHDEGLLFPRGSDAPVRRVRSESRETLQWRNPGTGASLRVSYPSEEVRLIPVSGQ